MATVMERLVRVVAEKLDCEPEKVTPSARFKEDLEADSLDLVELVMAFEEEFSGSSGKMEIPDEEAERLTTVQAALDYLSSLGAKDQN